MHGLTAAHQRLIVHRDLKPENLFLTNDGRIKILDFGVAKLQAPAEDNRSIENLTTVTKHGAMIGTVAYMSPEQLRGKAVDHRSDIFSFGAILYEMMAGCRAFRGETEVDTMTAVLREEPESGHLEDSAIPIGYRDIIKHCLEKEPENRFQSAKDLGFALQTLSASSPGRAMPFPKPLPRNFSVLPWALAAVLAVATAVLIFTPVLRVPAPSYTRLTFESGTVYAGRFTPDGQSIVYSAAWNNNPVQTFSTVGNSLLTQPLNLSDASLLAVSRSNELAVVQNGTHDGQLETNRRDAGSCASSRRISEKGPGRCALGGLGQRGRIRSRALRRRPWPPGISHRQRALSEQRMDHQHPVLAPERPDRIHGSSGTVGQSRSRMRG